MSSGAMAPQVIKRQPLSCENCRKRKIRCGGERPVCDTCVRRGFSHSCFYIRQQSQPTSLATGSSDEVLERVKRVESSSKASTAYSSCSQQDLSRSRQQLSPSLNSPPWTENEGSLIVQGRLSTAGVILTSKEGYERFIPGLASSDAGAINELIQSASNLTLASNFPFSIDTQTSRETLLEALPPARQCDELKSIFFQVFPPLFHILHDPTFHSQYARFRQSPGDVSISFLALLFVVFALAITTLDETHPLLRDLGLQTSASANVKAIAERYRSLAMRCLSADHFLWQHNLHTVQALVLLIYAISHAHGPSWALLGTAFNIAVSIGCHIDPSQLNLGPVEGEQRRRCWAGLMMLYTLQNTCLGNLAPMKITASVRLPADVDDEDVGVKTGSEVEGQGLSSIHRPPTKMSYVLFKFRLYQLASDICQSTRDRTDSERLQELDHRITREEAAYSSRFADTQRLPVYHLANLYILKNFAKHLRLILHRPYLQNHSREESEYSQQMHQSRQQCRDAAMTILANHEHLYIADTFRPYRWFIYGLGSFHAFLAASTLVVLLATETEQQYPDRAQIVDALQRGKRRFSHMAARSEICAKASSIMDRLLGDLLGTATDHSRLSKTYHGDSTVANDGFGMRTSQIHGQVPAEVVAPMRGFVQAGYAYERHAMRIDATSARHQLFVNAPQLQNLAYLPPEHWLVPSPLTWNWTGGTDVNVFAEYSFHGSEADMGGCGGTA